MEETKNNRKKNITAIISLVLLLVLVFSATYAFFTSNEYKVGANSTTNVTLENSNINLVLSANSSLSLNIDILNPVNETVMGQNSVSNDTASLVTDSDEDVICYYDIMYTPTSEVFVNSGGYTGKELVIKGSDSSGQNNNFTFNLNNVSSSTKMFTAKIQTSEANVQVNQTWTFTLVHYNLSDINQTNHLNKSYTGNISFVSRGCNLSANEVIAAISSNSGAGATDGHPGGMVNDEYGVRYIGENPSNFVWFNCSSLTNQNASTCERWRIIGVFDEKYDSDGDNIPDTIGPLIKIIRNDSLGNYSWDYKQSGVGSSTSVSGSNDWSDSQLMMMLNPPEFLNSGYVTENDASPVHSNTIDNDGYVIENGIKIYQNMGSYFDTSKTAWMPIETRMSGYSTDAMMFDYGSSTSLSTRMNFLSQPMIATVKWHLTGNSSSSLLNIREFYNSERNINDAGTVYTGRPKIWYGKVGLMYPSDYGFATSGNEEVEGYDRASCLNEKLYNWNSESYQTYCANLSWLNYNNATGGTSVTKGSASTQWTITPMSYNGSAINHIHFFDDSIVINFASSAFVVRPVLYLKNDVSFGQGDGSFNSPYSLSQ